MTWPGGLPRAGSDAEYGTPLWDDMRFPFTRDKQGQTQKPDYDFVNMGLLMPQNDPSEIVYITAQLPHGWEEGSELKPHIHFVQSVAQQPVFKLDYRWYNQGEDPLVSFTTIVAVDFAFTWTSGDLLQIVGFPALDGTGFTLSSMLDFKVYRDDNVVAGDVLGKEFDIHLQRDLTGSRQEFIK